MYGQSANYMPFARQNEYIIFTDRSNEFPELAVNIMTTRIADSGLKRF
jgi:hypothetical protein